MGRDSRTARAAPPTFGPCHPAPVTTPAEQASGSAVAWIALTIDCADAQAAVDLATFYAAALGGEVVQGSVRARGLLLIFEPIPDYRPPTWPSDETPKQMHFEWMVDDLEAAVTRLLELGARLAEHQTGTSLRVMLDPAGHPFCVATAAGVDAPFRDEARHQQR
jgi:catechol 2,3-dioxygenase-like lactoylglutathione lyase family enzyme